ncbi:MAG: hypothetical protein IKL28_04480 [Lachnospiraceae bacterium]|nr:hypothetical protein [Lachnospiraceae bacterium]
MKNMINSFHLKCICIGMMIVGVYMQQWTYNPGYLMYLAAFPIAAFLLVEAVRKTSDRKKLMKRLLLAALVVEIPMDIATFGLKEWTKWGLNQNYFFTLYIGFGVLVVVEALNKKYQPGTMANTLSTLAVYLASVFLSVFCRTEQGSAGVLMVVTFSLFYGNKVFSFLSAAVLYVLFLPKITGLEFLPALSVLLLWLYNGKPGKANKITRLVFYLAYPVAYCVLRMVAPFL